MTTTSTEGAPGMTEDDRYLAGLRVLDLTDAKGFMCGKAMGMLGADVIKIESPRGDRERHLPPRRDGAPQGEASLYWRSFNTDKRSVTLDLTHPRGRDILLRLAERVDFLIESFAPGHLAALGLGYDDLARVNPRLVMVSITPFGQTGPLSGYKGGELIALAMGAVLNNTGDADRPPVKEALESTYFQASMAAAYGALIAYWHVLGGGKGQQVDVSLQECVVSRQTSGILAWQFERLDLKREGDKSQLGPVSTTWFWPCKDGHLFWHMLGGLHGAPANRALTEWMDETLADNPLREIKDWRTFDKAGITQAQWNRFEGAIRPFFLTLTKDQIRTEGKRRGINACVANDPLDVLNCDHLASRDYWSLLNDPDLGPLRYPGYLFKTAADRHRTLRPAPALGADTDAVLARDLGLSEAQIRDLRNDHVL